MIMHSGNGILGGNCLLDQFYSAFKGFGAEISRRQINDLGNNSGSI